MKFGFNRESGFRGEDVWKSWQQMDGLTEWPWPLVTTYLHLVIQLTIYSKYCTLDLNSFWKSHCLSIFPYKSLTYQSWQCHKLGQGQRMVIICITNDGPKRPMLRSKFQGHRPSGSEEEDFWKIFYHIWAWWPSWSSDIDPGLTYFHSHIPLRLHMKFGFNKPSSFWGEDVWKSWRRTGWQNDLDL